MFEYLGNLLLKTLSELRSHFYRLSQLKEEILQAKEQSKADTIRSLELENKSLREINNNLRGQVRELSKASEELRRRSTSTSRRGRSGVSRSNDLLDMFNRNIDRPSVPSAKKKTTNLTDVLKQMKEDLEKLK